MCRQFRSEQLVQLSEQLLRESLAGHGRPDMVEVTGIAEQVRGRIAPPLILDGIYPGGVFELDGKLLVSESKAGIGCIIIIKVELELPLRPEIVNRAELVRHNAFRRFRIPAVNPCFLQGSHAHRGLRLIVRSIDSYGNLMGSLRTRSEVVLDANGELQLHLVAEVQPVQGVVPTVACRGEAVVARRGVQRERTVLGQNLQAVDCRNRQARCRAIGKGQGSDSIPNRWGGGKKVGQPIAAIHIGRAHTSGQVAGVTHRTVLSIKTRFCHGKGVRCLCNHRGVIGSGNGDGDGDVAVGTVLVHHPQGEGLGNALPCPQLIDLLLIGSERIGSRGPVQNQRPVIGHICRSIRGDRRYGNGSTRRSVSGLAGHPLNGENQTCLQCLGGCGSRSIVAVGIAGNERSCNGGKRTAVVLRAGEDERIAGKVPIGIRAVLNDRTIVGALNRHLQRLRGPCPVFVADVDGELLRSRLPFIQGVGRAVREQGIGIGTVRMQRQLAVGAVDHDGTARGGRGGLRVVLRRSPAQSGPVGEHRVAVHIRSRRRTGRGTVQGVFLILGGRAGGIDKGFLIHTAHAGLDDVELGRIKGKRGGVVSAGDGDGQRLCRPGPVLVADIEGKGIKAVLPLCQLVGQRVGRICVCAVLRQHQCAVGARHPDGTVRLEADGTAHSAVAERQIAPGGIFRIHTAKHRAVGQVRTAIRIRSGKRAADRCSRIRAGRIGKGKGRASFSVDNAVRSCRQGQLRTVIGALDGDRQGAFG